jgi:hypothetical protein
MTSKERKRKRKRSGKINTNFLLNRAAKRSMEGLKRFWGKNEHDPIPMWRSEKSAVREAEPVK